MITRRLFTQSSAATIVAMGLPACRSVPKTRPKSPNEEVRVAVAGIRSRGWNHVSALRKLPNVRVVALCDVDAEVLGKRAEEFGEPVDTHVDFRDVLDRKDVDAVSIATPNHWHALQAVWACQAGKDVYVEKPVSHNVWEGRQIVAASREYDRIVQTGTQSRSSEGIREAVEWLQGGGLGRIEVARGLCYKPRQSIGKVAGAQSIPESIDYDLWTGPAPLVPLMRKSLHYDWHWVTDTGNGDVGNQGIHQMDLARWALGETGLPPRVLSVGGRLGYDDDGNTPNSQVVVLGYERAPLVFEVRGLPRDKETQASGWNGGGMDDFMGAKIGVIVHCENGFLRIPNYSGATAHDRDGNEVQRWEGASDHFANFIDAVRSRRREDQNSDIVEGHVSSAMCHMGNVSHTLGESASVDEIRAELAGDAVATESVERLVQHLGANEVDLNATPLTLGRRLALDPRSERFGDDAANALLSRDYRAPFVVPSIG